MKLEELQKRIDDNAKKINHNLQKIENNSKNIQKNSIAFEILKDYKKSTQRLYMTLILIIVLWAITLFVFHL